MRRNLILALLFICIVSTFLVGQEAQPAQPGAQPAPPVSAWKYIAAAAAVGFGCIGGGMAVGQIGAAAMGAMAEKPELSGKALPYVGLAEGICLWGFLVALIMLLL